MTILQRPQDGHHARHPFVQIFAHEVLQQGQLDGAVGLRNTDGVQKLRIASGV